MERSRVFDWLKGNGISKIVIEFSGGNDEGSIDEVRMYDDAGDEISTGITIPSEIEEALEEPVWDEYGGFAGGFSVSGALSWDVKTLKVKLSGQELDWVPFRSREV